MTSLREIFLVSTPIGNIDDISKRAVCVLTQADAIIAEDYRNAVKLLNRLSIPVSDKTIYEINEHNERKESTSLVEKLLFTHKTAVLISDSGTPVIADPGWLFTKTARSYGITIRHVPGGNSVIGSLQISGLPADNFYYAGFLPRREDERRQKLREIRYIPSTIIIMETPYRLRPLLQSINKTFPPEKPIAISFDITGTQESLFTGTIREAAAKYSDNFKGKLNFVLMIDNTGSSFRRH